MRKEKKLIIDTIIYGISSFGSKLLTFILLPIYSSYFTKSEFGEWDIIITTISLITPLISLEIVSSLYRWLLESKTLEDKKSVITTTFVFKLKSLFFFSIFYLILGHIYKIKYYYLIYLMVIFLQLDSYLLKLLRGISKNKEFALIGIIKSIFSLFIAFICIYVLKIKIETYLYISIFTSLIGILLGIYYSRIWLYIKKENYSKNLLKELKRYSIPLIPGTMNWWIMNSSDRYIVLLVLGMSINGIYAMANKFPTVLVLINSIFFMAWQDNSIKEFNNIDKDIYYSKIFKYYSRVMFFMASVLIIINRSVLKIFLSSEYQEVWKFSNLLYFATIFSFFSSFWGIGYHASKDTKIIMNTTLIGAVINFFINIILIKKIGLYAACLSTIFSYIIMWIIRIKKAKKFKISINKIEFIIMLILIIFSLTVSYFKNIYLEILMLVIIMIYYIFINLEELKYLYNKKIINKFKVKRDSQI